MKGNLNAFLSATLLLFIIFTARSADDSDSAREAEASIKAASLSASSVTPTYEPGIPAMEIAVAASPNETSKGASNEFYANANLPEISAPIAEVVLIDTGSVIFGKNIERRWPLASLSKLMTTLVSVKNIGLEKRIELSENDILAEGDAGDLKSGEIFDVRDLITAMLTVSSNDAADALSRFYGNGLFIEAMNAEAMTLGMTSTTFVDPSGLSAVNQSTAKDIVVLLKYLIDNYPELFTVSRQKETSVTELGSGKSRKLANIDKFAGEPDFLGGKTGYTQEANGNLATVWKIEGHHVAIVVLGANDRFAETQRLRDWAKIVLK